MGRFWVVGGEYENTEFTTAVGQGEEWIGPFDDYEAARKLWASKAWQTVDDAHARYRIEELPEGQQPPSAA